MAITRGPEWDGRHLQDLVFHDDIWFNAIREYLRVEDRKGSALRDVVLDSLIHQGLTSKDEDHMSAAFQQVARYSAVLAGRVTGHVHRVEKSVLSSPLLLP